MIELNSVCFKYSNDDSEALKNVSLHIDRGECVLLCGQSGCGKTTLTRLINGLVPHYYEGDLSGQVRVGGLDVRNSELYDTARVVGSVFQNPRSQFFCVDTTGEIAFGCENLGMPALEIDRRVSEAAAEMRAENLLGRSIFNLSGGEKQKIACASVSAMRPEVFVLDEPTSNLDLEAIEDLKSNLQSWKNEGKTIVIAEHRLYWLRELCGRVVYLENGEVKFDIPMKEFRSFSPAALADLGLRALSLDELTVADAVSPVFNGFIKLKDYRYSYRGGKEASLDIPETALPEGGVIAVIGRNGAGKSTLAKSLCGLMKKQKGICNFGGDVCKRRRMLKRGFMVMQDVNHQLFCESVEEELRLGMNTEDDAELERVIQALDLAPFMERHPLSLSGGQKQRVAVASALLAGKKMLVFDEPTSGLDFRRMEQTARLLGSMSGGRTILIVTHDPELIVRCCNYVLVMELGKIRDQYPLDKEGEHKLRNFFGCGKPDCMPAGSC